MPEASVTTASQRIEAGFDANLDFPLDNASWAAFSTATRCAITSYTDLDVLTSALRQRLFDFSYLPSSNCFFLRDVPYRGIVSALTPITHQPSQSSVFVVAKDNPATSWRDLRGKRLGYINTYCTTSYFSPSVLLGREGFALKDFFVAFPVTADRSTPCWPVASMPRWSTRTSGWRARKTLSRRRSSPASTICRHRPSSCARIWMRTSRAS